MPRLSLLPLLLLALLATMLTSLSWGRYPLPPGELMAFLFGPSGFTEQDPERQAFLYHLIVEIRLPRILAAVLVGAALAISGAAFQAVFRNPLVSPGLLGVLAGAACGAALGLTFSDSWWVMQSAAFGMGFLAVGVGVGIAALFGGSIVMLVLGGILSGALFTALLSLIKYTADPYNQLPAIVYWLMGSLASADLADLARLSLPMGLGIVLLSCLGRAMDALSMGDEEAAALGIPVKTVRYGVIALATLVSALTVSLAGVIGWIGLLAPHVTRLITGPGNRLLLPASALLGGIFLLLADGVARNLAETEIPIGIVTELLGIPVFLLVLSRARRGWAL
ncbi:MAG: iron ABC transporter permease [Zoogloeaceae bacterium]|jgi:iron complex transport system permease protein|nr:iron ABC transporter permease [Zoogloeaceae bacterium]